MGALLSKLSGPSVPYQCYETCHPWSTTCHYAWAYMFASCVQHSGKVYSILYLFSQLGLSRKVSLKAFQQTLSSTATSTLFLSYNVFFFLFFICLLRQAQGRLHLPMTAFVSGCLSSFLAILVERPNRRKMLALYMFNIFAEVVFNFGASRGWLPVVPYGDVMLFAAGLAGHSYLLSESSGKDPISSALTFLVGKDEFLQSPRSKCRHPIPNCLVYSLDGFVRPFLLGYLGRCALVLATSVPRIVRSPSSFGQIALAALTNRAFLRQGAFLGAAVSTFRFVRCQLRGRGLDEKVCRAIAGAAAGSWMAVSRNTTLAQYVFWKVAESYYSLGVSKGLLPQVPMGTEIVYTFSTAFTLFMAVMEPINVRPSYVKFLNNITGTALSLINRHPLDSMSGFHVTSLYGNNFPTNMDLSKVHPSFIEQVAIWS